MNSGGRHLLVVDDDDRIRDLLKAYLTREGFRVTTGRNAAAARQLLEALEFDLAVLDVMMPGEDGVSLTRWLRGEAGAKGRTPVLMLTARGEAEARIHGLSAGADDYLPKPFEPQELLLRIEAILRRAAPRAAGGLLTLGRCAFDAGRGELICDDLPVRLTEGEVALLRQLARSAHQPIDRLDLVQAGGGAADGRAIDVQVTRLRRKIEPDPKNPRYLQTVRGVGYMLAPDEPAHG